MSCDEPERLPWMSAWKKREKKNNILAFMCFCILALEQSCHWTQILYNPTVWHSASTIFTLSHTTGGEVAKLFVTVKAVVLVAHTLGTGSSLEIIIIKKKNTMLVMWVSGKTVCSHVQVRFSLDPAWALIGWRISHIPGGIRINKQSGRFCKRLWIFVSLC